MNKKNLALAIVMGLTFAKGVFAADPETEKEDFDINSITYIQEEDEIELGFDVADYLPEGFDPYAFYFNLDSVEFIEEEWSLDFDTAQYLPEGFDAYADPVGIEGINYIDENDAIELDLTTENYLPEGFNAYL
ncbi:MAG: hypothetical protein Mars2KO_45110 [Maribacter sp.]|uniref:hypothetical protein n=1 Tax=Maribacter sp. 2307UL18-2 TaxID=3386274 RepID=UPI0039BD4CC1